MATRPTCPSGACAPTALAVVVGLLVASQGVDDPAEHTRLENNAAAIVVDCVRHGLVLPAEIIAKES